MMVSCSQIFTAKYQNCCRKEEILSQERPRDCIAPTAMHHFQNKDCKFDCPHNPDSNQSIGQQNYSGKIPSESEISQITLHRSSSIYVMGNTRVKKRWQLQLPLKQYALGKNTALPTRASWNSNSDSKWYYRFPITQEAPDSSPNHRWVDPSTQRKTRRNKSCSRSWRDRFNPFIDYRTQIK